MKKFELTDADYEKKFYNDRKSWITLVFENSGIAICDTRFKESIVRCKCLKVIQSYKWKDVYDFCFCNGLLKD